MNALKVIGRYWTCWGGLIAMMFFIFRKDIALPKPYDVLAGLLAAWTIGCLIGKGIVLIGIEAKRDAQRQARWEEMF